MKYSNLHKTQDLAWFPRNVVAISNLNRCLISAMDEVTTLRRLWNLSVSAVFTIRACLTRASETQLQNLLSPRFPQNIFFWWRVNWPSSPENSISDHYDWSMWWGWWHWQGVMTLITQTIFKLNQHHYYPPLSLVPYQARSSVEPFKPLLLTWDKNLFQKVCQPNVNDTRVVVHMVQLETYLCSRYMSKTGSTHCSLSPYNKSHTLEPDVNIIMVNTAT